MKWIPFHHPDISFPVVRRRMAMEMVELLNAASCFASRGGWAVLNRACYPNRKLYREATYRLRNKGLIIKQSEDATKTPQLVLTKEGELTLPAFMAPEKFWNRKWNDIWYMLIYDVPEVDRHYRDVLRQFLKRLRLGCLQQSVWITPCDIRPEFDDLVKGASVDAFAYLFESRTVLGLPSRRVVDDAWNFDRLYNIQLHFCQVLEKNLERLADDPGSPEELAFLMRMSLDGLQAAYVEDPLLPRALLPSAYQGEKAFQKYQTLMAAIGDKLSGA
ncbi:MAG: PaaX family transcriptional regulator C-terminal domain-containing protein [Pontiella sp.]